jgi:hypothetical protein
VRSPDEAAAARVLARLASLRQYQRHGRRAPYKPLLVLLALGRLAATGSSEFSWPDAEAKLAGLIAEFGPPSRTGKAQSAAYPFTRLRADGIWVLDQDVPMDLVGPLARGQVTGRLEASAERALLAWPALIRAAARDLVLNNFPATVAPDVLQSAGLDPGEVLGDAGLVPAAGGLRGGADVTPGGGLRCWRPGTGSARSAGMTGRSPGPAWPSRRRTCGGSPSTGQTPWTTAWPCARCIISCST